MDTTAQADRIYKLEELLLNHPDLKYILQQVHIHRGFPVLALLKSTSLPPGIILKYCRKLENIGLLDCNSATNDPFSPEAYFTISTSYILLEHNHNFQNILKGLPKS